MEIEALSELRAVVEARVPLAVYRTDPAQLPGELRRAPPRPAQPDPATARWLATRLRAQALASLATCRPITRGPL